MIFQILKALFFYMVLMYLSVNLLGLFVRGLFPELELIRIKKEGLEHIKRNVREYQRQQIWITLIALILNIAFFYLLFRIWNIGVVIATVMIMVGKLPDLLWDIKHGKKTDPKLMKKNALYYLSTLLPLTALPVLYYSLYHF